VCSSDLGPFAEALAAARAVYANPDATQAEVDAAQAALAAAAAALVRVTPPGCCVGPCADDCDCNGECDREDCDCEPPVGVNREPLRIAISQANTRVQADFTAETWAPFAAALAEAERVYADPNATQAQLDAARTNLLNAMNALVRRPGPPGPQGPGGAAGADGRPVPKTGDDANMSLWMMIFGFGALGFLFTSGKMAMDKRHASIRVPSIIMKDDNGEDSMVSVGQYQ
jgi:hypothetical protein